MKTLLIFSLFLLLNGALFSQLNNTTKIVDFYGQERVTMMEQETPELLTLLDKYISHGFMVKNVSHGKYAEFVPLTTIQLSRKEGGEVTVEEFLLDFESANFNPLNYKFFPGKDFQVFKLSGVDKIIYILPQETILLK